MCLAFCIKMQYHTFDNKMIVVRAYSSLYCHLIKFYHFLCYAVYFGNIHNKTQVKKG